MGHFKSSVLCCCWLAFIHWTPEGEPIRFPSQLKRCPVTPKGGLGSPPACYLVRSAITLSGVRVDVSASSLLGRWTVDPKVWGYKHKITYTDVYRHCCSTNYISKYGLLYTIDLVTKYKYLEMMLPLLVRYTVYTLEVKLLLRILVTVDLKLKTNY